MLCTLFNFLFALVVCNSLRNSDASAFKGCEKLLHELAEGQKNFVQCATINSAPVTLCAGCKPPHSDMVLAYESLVKNETCNKKYFDKDRINIVATTQSFLTGLWNKAFCDDCFENDNEVNFNNKSEALNDCFNENKHIECTSCLLKYQDLNSFYIGIDQHANGKVCYDVQDMMNCTRKRWSDEFKCCHREINRFFFSITSSFVALLPISFYGLMYVLTKRRERNHGLLDAEPELQTPPPPSVHSNTTARQNSVSTSTVPAIQRKLLTDSDDDESDEPTENINYHKKLISL